ncbi:MAG: hypothetical protein ABEL97_00255 [Salinibacter sp.]
MSLFPLDHDETGADEEAPVTLTGIEVSGGNREQVLEALRLNRQILHEPQPDAEVDEAAVRRTIDALLEQLRDAS